MRTAVFVALLAVGLPGRAAAGLYCSEETVAEPDVCESDILPDAIVNSATERAAPPD